MKSTSAWSVAALGLSALGVAGAMAFDSAGAGETYERPFIDVRVDPDIGATKPTVRIERIRRSLGEDERAGTGGAGGAYDTGMINFELLVTNYGEDPIEVDRIVTHFNGLNAPIPSGWFEGMGMSDLMHNRNDSWANDGNVISEDTAADYVIAVSGEALIGNLNDYIVAGAGVFGGDLKFYVGRHNDWKGELQDESFPFPGHAFHVAPLEGFEPQPIYVVGQRNFEDEDQRGVIVKYDTSGTEIALDPGFGNGGIVEVDVPFHVDERLLKVAPVVVSGQIYVMAAGTVSDNGKLRPFLVRLHADGSPDESFGGLGIKLFGPVIESRKPMALGFRVDPGDIKPRIYLLEGVGDGIACDYEGIGCTTQLTRLRWADGGTDAGFGNAGTATLAFPDSLSDIPYGLVLLQGGKIIIGATRMQKVTKAPWVGLAGLTVDGKLDPAFALWGYRVVSLNLQPVGGRGMVRNGNEIAVGGMVLVPTKREVALFTFDHYGNPTHMESNRQDPSEYPRILDFDVDYYGQYVMFGYELVRTQITRFRKDKRLDWYGVIDYDETQRIRWPDDREVEEFPSSVSFDLFIEEWILPFTIEAQVKEDPLKLFFPLEPPGELEWWRVSQQHRLRDDHRGALSQRYAYDFSMYRWSKLNSVWTNKNKVWEDDDPLNTRYLAYGRSVRAAKKGVVVGCWNVAPENQFPPKKDAFDPEQMPYGGNVVNVLHDDGTIAHYAHFQPGSIPPAVCPNTCTIWTDDATIPWTPALEGIEDATCNEAIEPQWPIEVGAGDFLGFVGNAGNSTGPHLHFHVSDAKGGRPIYFYKTETEQQIEPDPPQNNPVPLDGQAAAAPKLGDDHTLLFNQ